MRKLYFVRHGQSTLNVSRHFAGHTDAPLTKAGIKQSEKAGLEAKELDIDLIVSSPLSRALDTAKIIANNIGYGSEKIITNDLLMERYYGTAEETAYSMEPEHLENFEGFETEEEVSQRAEKILSWLNKLPYGNILVVSHGGIGRRIRVLAKPEHDFFDPIPNAEIVRWV